jgi:DUF971 family protein
MNPTDVRPVGDSELLISWEDGHRSLYLLNFLRLNCPCASCRDEWTGKRLITLDRIPADIKISNTEAVGRYAYRFKWSDGHQTGIYSFDFLRGLCPCEICQKKSSESKPN